MQILIMIMNKKLPQLPFEIFEIIFRYTFTMQKIPTDMNNWRNYRVYIISENNPRMYGSFYNLAIFLYKEIYDE